MKVIAFFAIIVLLSSARSIMCRRGTKKTILHEFNWNCTREGNEGIKEKRERKEGREKSVSEKEAEICAQSSMSASIIKSKNSK